MLCYLPTVWSTYGNHYRDPINIVQQKTSLLCLDIVEVSFHRLINQINCIPHPSRPNWNADQDPDKIGSPITTQSMLNPPLFSLRNLTKPSLTSNINFQTNQPQAQRLQTNKTGTQAPMVPNKGCCKRSW